MYMVFCRFHELPEFDDSKRSCRRHLLGHNQRRRKVSYDFQGEGWHEYIWNMNYQQSRSQLNDSLQCSLSHSVQIIMWLLSVFCQSSDKFFPSAIAYMEVIISVLRLIYNSINIGVVCSLSSVNPWTSSKVLPFHSKWKVLSTLKLKA